MSARFDARAAWAAKTAEEQQRIGELSLLSMVASCGDGECWEHAMIEADLRLADLVPQAADYPAGPDLAALGIRACRNCGCTEASGCEGGCWWVEPDLCSNCALDPALEGVAL